MFRRAVVVQDVEEVEAVRKRRCAWWRAAAAMVGGRGSAVAGARVRIKNFFALRIAIARGPLK